jgi:hypothetical protein
VRHHAAARQTKSIAGQCEIQNLSPPVRKALMAESPAVEQQVDVPTVVALEVKGIAGLEVSE